MLQIAQQAAEALAAPQTDGSHTIALGCGVDGAHHSWFHGQQRRTCLDGLQRAAVQRADQVYQQLAAGPGAGIQRRVCQQLAHFMCSHLAGILMYATGRSRGSSSSSISGLPEPPQLPDGVQCISSAGGGGACTCWPSSLWATALQGCPSRNAWRVCSLQWHRSSSQSSSSN